MSRVNLVICLHNHQPVGNFDHVFEHNYKVSYKPFLDVYEKFSDLKIGLHCSGPLWDWLVANKPAYIKRIKKLTSAGSLEIVAGAYYEPILAMLPEEDRQGQIKKMRNFIKEHFDQDAKGFWLAERIWEQEMASSLVDAGIEYTFVDDSHFKNAGLSKDQLYSYYKTEDQGRVMSLYGTNEQLRYFLPFKSPEEIRDYLGYMKDTHPDALLVYGDDGEKFGGWPGTADWVFKQQWLEKFFQMLTDNKDWINLVKPHEALSVVKPAGKVYIPDSSYREMMEWALPIESGHNYENTRISLQDHPAWEVASNFIRGGFWRNFKYKYSEINQMYARTIEISKAIETSESSEVEKARDLLYQAQCNCPYWHGVFGGLYLNHLRFETFRNIIRAQKLLNKYIQQNKDFIAVTTGDLDFDGREEVVLENKWHRLYLQAHNGGRIYEWDYYPANSNILDTLSRREETYHKKILEAPETLPEEGLGSIHDIWKLKDPTIKEHLTYDRHERKSFIDHIITGNAAPVTLRKNEIREHGPLAHRDYVLKIDEKKDSVRATFTHSGEILIDGTNNEVKIEKSITLYKKSSKVDCEYQITNIGSENIDASFGMEWNFALLAGQADDRYFWCEDETKAGKLVAELTKVNVKKFGVVDEWQNIRADFEFDDDVTLHTFPIETVSQSESAFEKVYQSSLLYPVVELNLKNGESQKIAFTLNVHNFR